jgi:hypothetical protein
MGLYLVQFVMERLSHMIMILIFVFWGIRSSLRGLGICLKMLFRIRFVIMLRIMADLSSISLSTKIYSSTV